MSLSRQGPATCPGFVDLENLDREKLRRNYGRAILGIRGEESGTGFIIDLNQGYILTAAHVIRSESNSSGMIKAFSEYFDGEIELEIIKDLGGRPTSYNDIALLKVKSVEDLVKVNDFCTSLDISFNLPFHETNLWSLSYTRDLEELHVKDLLIRRGTSYSGQKNLYNVTSNPLIDSGDSGAPVINENGFVIGITLSIISSNGYFVPLGYSSPLLNEIQMSERLVDFSESFLNNTLTDKELRAKLTRQRKPIYSFSNLELYLWALNVHHNKSKYKEFYNRVRCPISKAYQARRLDDIIWYFDGLLSKIETARSYHRKANYESILGDSEGYRMSLGMAKTNYEEAVSGYLNDNPEILGYVAYRYPQAENLISEGFSEYQVNPNGNSFDGSLYSNYFSAILKDYSLLLYREAKLEDNPETRETVLNRSLFYSVISAITAEDSAFKAGAYGLTGDILFGLNEYEKAMDAYSLAFQNGSSSTWLVNNFNSAQMKLPTSFPGYASNALTTLENHSANLNLEEILRRVNVTDVKLKKEWY
ncbi:S1 family peptidase [Roseivirga sp.]|uniref:S1 family peptidase n=1 Tax=Roseivirga sp. TaxID=1964215 RepID=UPI003B51683B